MSGAFDKLARPVQKWIRQQGWRELRNMQVRTIHEIMDGGADLIIAASTASGKTEAAFLPLISQILTAPAAADGFDILYIGPLKALITDQAERIEGMCRDTELAVVPWHGDISRSVKTRALKSPNGILMITPESLEALFVRRGLEIRRLFGATRAVIVDELHSILDSERGIQTRSLLTRLELRIGRPVRRIGLSATLGDMGLARAYLRPDGAADVRLIEVEENEAELRLQLRGHVSGTEGESETSTTEAITSHLFRNLRGSDNLVFAGSRQSVEIYADRLRERCDQERLPQEFYPHHANLSCEHRKFVECRLKDGVSPTTAVCTSTLELGIDIGDVTSVAQVGSPFSVAALRQRLGRSGRREGCPAILRQYSVEARLSPGSSIVDQLRIGLLRAIAMIELLLERWCEPPRPQALHLSTLVHQILSTVAERGGAYADQLYRVLCQQGPFRKITKPIFVDVLRALGSPRVKLIEQSKSGLLLLGEVGERLTERHGFYAVFKTPKEYCLVEEGRELGALPVNNILSPGMMLIFSGRRWLVREINEGSKVIVVVPAKAGSPPVFGGEPGEVHDKVVERMFELLENDCRPAYMDPPSLELLGEARHNYRRLGLSSNPIVSLGEGFSAVATRVGTIKTTTLALALRRCNMNVEQHDGFLLVREQRGGRTVSEAIELNRKRVCDDIFSDQENLMFEKYHWCLSRDLLRLDALSSRLDVPALPELCRALLKN